MSEKRIIHIKFSEFRSLSELEKDDNELVSAAREASGKAYAPYSGFMVGAAIRLNSGKIIMGANVENAAFPSGICAERSAISNSVSNYPDDYPVAIAVAARTADGFTEDYVSPCGSCRQVIAEEETRTGREIRLILSGRDTAAVISGISSLLPLQFNKQHLRPGRP
ncbi:MAG: cytidine deaminase [Bacteroidales bacterium]|jgi:cytidine deaminase|nr:cytidine deaminase [Bacteroidales bacterium]MCU0409108.1 cytidine deaminase [Bacteroidales bacterium]